MPITSSATKALRQDRSRAARNLVQKNQLKKALKTVTKDTHALTVSLIDKAAKKNLIHKNKASRLKALVAKKVGVSSKKRPGAGTPETKSKPKVTKKESK